LSIAKEQVQRKLSVIRSGVLNMDDKHEWSDRNVMVECPRLREIVALILGGIGIFILDLAFNGSSESDLFFPPQLRKALPQALTNATLPPSPAAPGVIGGYLPVGQNIYLYAIGGAFLGVAMLILIVTNRNSGKDLY